MIIGLILLALLIIWALIYAIREDDIFGIWILMDLLGDVLQALGECLSSIDWNSD